MRSRSAPAAHELGCHCVVVAPALIPRPPGAWVKTDRRDATTLATLHRAGELTPVWVPDATHEAMRDLVRARAAAARASTTTRQQLRAFLLRHQRVHAGRALGPGASALACEPAFRPSAQQIVLQDYISAVEDAVAPIARLMDQIEELVRAWSPGGRRRRVAGDARHIPARRRDPVAEVGDFTRFANPRQLPPAP
jgi:transposase